MDIANRILIHAAGGLVENEKGEILFMYRRDKWDLPKGKLDEGETLAQCAVREVQEETGISQLELKEFLLVTEHIYEERGVSVLKKSHWWLMKTSSTQPLTPQREEDITELKWIGAKDFHIVLSNTYPAIIEVLKAGGRL